MTYITENYDVYGMGMFTDEWPYIPTYDGKGFVVNELNSSLWRPKDEDATWEETFHTITEAFNRIDDDFKFTEGAYLRELMDDDILNGTYDISEQNDLESGKYDSETAVNEYIYQIWQINFSGQSDILNFYQNKVLFFWIWLFCRSLQNLGSIYQIFFLHYLPYHFLKLSTFFLGFQIT